MFEVAELPRPGIREYKVIRVCRLSVDECRAVVQVKGDARVRSKMPARDSNDCRIVVNRLELRRLVHPGEKPRRCNARSGAKFEKPSPWLRRDERSQQRSGLRLRSHREADVDGLVKDRLERDRRINDVTIVQ